MVKLVLLQLLALVVLATCGPNDVFTYLGFYVNSDYWVGETKSGANNEITAKCVEHFGTGTIVTSIGNVNEFNWLKSRLSTDFPCVGCTLNYWIGGKWDVTGVAADSLPVLSVNGTTVTVKIGKRVVLNKYICEAPSTTTTPSPYNPNTQDPPASPTPVDPCPNVNDVIVVLDSSGSIGPDNYKKEKVLAYDLARAFENQPTNRFGFTIFSSSVRKIAPLNNNFTPTELNSKILNADYMAFQTHTHLAINSAVAEFSALGRPGVTQNLVVITDGVSNYRDLTTTAINNAISNGIRTFAVGIGSGTNDDELDDLSGRDPSHLFTAANFDELTALLDPLRDVVCEPDD